jgi:hypothetical protein
MKTNLYLTGFILQILLNYSRSKSVVLKPAGAKSIFFYYTKYLTEHNQKSRKRRENTIFREPHKRLLEYIFKTTNTDKRKEAVKIPKTNFTSNMTVFWDIALCSLAVGTPETSVYSSETTRRYIPEDSHLHTPRRENLKSQNFTSFIVLSISLSSEKGDIPLTLRLAFY